MRQTARSVQTIAEGNSRHSISKATKMHLTHVARLNLPLRKIISPPLAPYQINPLSLQSDEVPRQTIGKDYLHGINRFLHFEFPTFSY